MHLSTARGEAVSLFLSHGMGKNNVGQRGLTGLRDSHMRVLAYSKDQGVFSACAAPKIRREFRSSMPSGRRGGKCYADRQWTLINSLTRGKSWILWTQKVRLNGVSLQKPR